MSFIMFVSSSDISLAVPDAYYGVRLCAVMGILLALTGAKPIVHGACAQPSPHATSLQLGGGSGMVGLHYQYRGADAWAGRVGVGGGILPIPDLTGDDDFLDVAGVVGVPLGVSWLPGDGAVRPDVSVSVAPGLLAGAIPVVWGGPSAGLRYHPRDGGLYLRGTVNLLVAAGKGEVFSQGGFGLGIGYAF